MSQANILIIDDNQNNLFSLRTLIEDNFDNIAVFQANSGLIALSLLLKHKVDLIFLDVEMPKMNGFETARMIQKRSKTRNIPIVFMTSTYKVSQFRQAGLELGTLDYLIKPIDENQLQGKVQTYLRLIQQTEQPIDEIEQNINLRITEIVSAANHSFQNREIVFERQQIEDFNDKVLKSIISIVTSNQIVKQDLQGLGNNELFIEIDKIDLESKFLLELVHDILTPKLKI